LTHPAQVTFLGLRLSRAVLGTRLNNIDDAVMRVVRRDTPALALLTRYLGLALDDALPAPSELQGLMASHVYELAAMAIGASGERAVIAHGLGVRAVRLRAITADIVANLADCELNVSAVAARHGVTPRYIHKLFAYEGMTYSGFVLGLRLDRVHWMLTDSRYVGHSISALAFGTGFSDLSYFNRAFRRRYGATPSDIRRYGQ
jgi:AraC-like DNA-binding protein